jgi:hypothetical protein
MDMNLAKQFGSLIARKREVEDELRAVKSEIAALEPLLLEELRNNQMERLSVSTGNGSVTLYTHKLLVAKPKDGNRPQVVATLKANGLADLVSENYNSNTLSAYVREHLANGEMLPAALAEVIETEEIVSLRGRRSAATSESKTAAAVRTLEANSNG